MNTTEAPLSDHAAAQDEDFGDESVKVLGLVIWAGPGWYMVAGVGR